MNNQTAITFAKRTAVVVVTVLMLLGTATAQPPSLEGAYRLVSRQLPDGTVRTAADATGLLTFTKTHRNLHIVWKGANGILCSYSLAASYSLTPGQYAEKILFSSLNDYRAGDKVAFDLVKRNQKVKVMTAGETSSTPPIDSPTIVINGNRLITSAEGAFIDTWEKIESTSGDQAANPD